MKLTKEQKTNLAKQLGNVYGFAELMCDGRKITLQVERASKRSLSYHVVMYIDGQIRGAWFSAKEDLPEHKFMRKSVKRLHSAQAKAKAEKAYGKRFVKTHLAHYDHTHTQFLPYWSTGKAAIDHLCKACDSVEIIEREATVAEAVNAISE
ncbi:MAG: hypothetical protein JWL63_3235 [Rhodocyclales bacterium]|nr:hypothetical protein [Rhodocyclales bacterium]